MNAISKLSTPSVLINGVGNLPSAISFRADDQTANETFNRNVDNETKALPAFFSVPDFPAHDASSAVARGLISTKEAVKYLSNFGDKKQILRALNYEINYTNGQYEVGQIDYKMYQSRQPEMKAVKNIITELQHPSNLPFAPLSQTKDALFDRKYFWIDDGKLSSHYIPQYISWTADKIINEVSLNPKQIALKLYKSSKLPQKDKLKAYLNTEVQNLPSRIEGIKKEISALKPQNKSTDYISIMDLNDDQFVELQRRLARSEKRLEQFKAVTTEYNKLK